MNSTTRDKWENHYRAASDTVPEPATVLANHLHLLPKDAKALDLACGKGGNALCLAKQGLLTHAWDISSTALELLLNFAKQENLTILIEERDISANPPETASFDVIVVSRFLDRNIIMNIKQALKPGGLIFYQTFITEKVTDYGPNNPDYLFKPNELLNFFQDYKIVFYREERKLGNLEKGFRNEAMLIAEKP